MNCSSPIGVFDSGVGGISVLKTLIQYMPHEDFIYYGDTLNAPYGTKSDESILLLVENAVQLLLKKDVKAIVIACNTATAVAAGYLRNQYALPIIGMEPALKLAWDTVGPDRKILVLATPATVRSAKYQKLNTLYGDHAVSLSCPGLMEFAERNELDSPELHAYLDRTLTEDILNDLSAVVLGCTHYVFLKKAICAHTGSSVQVLDGNAGTARQLMRRLQENNMINQSGNSGKITVLSSGGTESVKNMLNLLKE